MNQEKKLVRILTCGSVDNGKSTLIGRLMLDSKALMEDQIAAVTNSQFSRGELNLAMFTDGLTEERERGITIDVAYRYFSTPTHKFILADCPGHAEYTRNMATGASNSDIALILVDPNYVIGHKELESQTKLHYRICSLFGLATVFVINKADTLAWDYDRLGQVEEVIDEFTGGLQDATIAISALTGENVSKAREEGNPFRPSLMELVTRMADDQHNISEGGVTVAIQAPCRHSSELRNRAVGNILSGVLRLGERVQVYTPWFDRQANPSHSNGSVITSHVDYLGILGRDVGEVVQGDAIEIGIVGLTSTMQSGYVIASADNPMHPHNRLQVTLVWMSDSLAVHDHPGYIIRTELGSTGASIMYGASLLDPTSGALVDTQNYSLMTNDIAQAALELENELLVPECDYKSAPGRKFILIDKKSGDTVAAGFIN